MTSEDGGMSAVADDGEVGEWGEDGRGGGDVLVKIFLDHFLIFFFF